MAKNSIVPLTELIAQFERLPGIGRKTAQRLAYSILEQPPERAEKFAEALLMRGVKYISAASVRG